VSFEITGRLPEGTTVIEASAGAGKTYAIVGLATRYVAEGLVDLSQLMLVTFGRAATQELRDRTRARFVATVAALSDPDAARGHEDELIRYLAQGPDADVVMRRGRLVAALSDFDAATIATTHSFCQRMLDGLGIAGQREPNASFVESLDDMVEEVVSDLYLANYTNDQAPMLGMGELREAARAGVSDRHAVLAPADAPPDSAAGCRVRFAELARNEVERRKRMRGIRDFDDLLVLLRNTLADPVHGQTACQLIRRRYRVVLVDEFQDTDPVQWDILRRAFHGAVTLILVGDPKHAIYAFRGAEVLSYLDALRVADERLELTVNWRSDPGLLSALNHLYGHVALGHPDIVAHPVRASHTTARLTDASALRLRYFDRRGPWPLTASGIPRVGGVRPRVARDVADDLVALLRSERLLNLNGASRPVQPGDVAILVRKSAQAHLVREALERAGIPSVLVGGSSVFTTPSARHWLWLLEALEQPHRAERVRLAALTPLLGGHPHDLAAGGDDYVAGISADLRDYAELFSHAGLAAVFEEIANRTHLERRLLAIGGGERDITDLRHVLQLLNRVVVEQSFGLMALAHWLAERINDPSLGDSRDRSRLLDSDAEAVHIVTIHASKGLEFPIVYVPYGWDGAQIPNLPTLLLHENGTRIRDVGGATGPGYATRKAIHNVEESGEELRLLYVALTRAMCQAVIWWSPSTGTSKSPLHRLLMGRTLGQAEPAATARIPEDNRLRGTFEQWAQPAADVISIEAVQPAPEPQPRWVPPPEVAAELRVARFDRSIDYTWRRTSYSALTASAHDAQMLGSETDEYSTTDEPENPLADAQSQSPADVPSLMNLFPSSATFGTLVHAILEVVDTSARDLGGEVRTRAEQIVASRLASADPGALAAALEAVMLTPLGHGSLADIAPTDRLSELDFELPLAGGDEPAGSRATLSRIAGLLRRHLPADDPLVSYPDVLDALSGPPLRGFLTGSIDAVLRRPGPEFIIVDYKTNKLARGAVTTTQFNQQSMATEMIRAHYPLQALVYSVALHRYLRWRQGDYDPIQHLGGTQYLFVRGMIGAATPVGCGVFTWKPPPDLIVELSDLLAGS
jgi:exodeoxyribonuclease V beta subunit